MVEEMKRGRAERAPTETKKNFEQNTEHLLNIFLEEYMSIICTVYLNDISIMATDSRVTIKEWSDLDKIFYFDNMKKVLWLDKVKVGISFCGNARINGMLVPEYLNWFQNEILEVGDSPELVAVKLGRQRIKKTTFCVCGIYNDELYAYEVRSHRKKRLNKNNSCGAWWAGERYVLDKLHSATEIDYSGMSLQDGIRWAEKMVRMTISEKETCGGNVHILVIDGNSDVASKKIANKF